MGYGVASGAAGSINIRGIGGNPVTGVLVLRDGRPDIMGLMGHAIPDAYFLDGVEKIEVVRGPASFLYGTNAMGGVINIVSKRVQHDGFKTQIRGGAGEYNTRKLFASHGGKQGRFSYHATAAIRQTDGHRPYSDYEADTYTVNFGYDMANSSLQLNANLSNIDLLDPGPVSNPFTEHWYDLNRSGLDLSYSNTNRFGDSYIKLHGNFGRHRIYDGFRSTDFTSGVMLYHNASPWLGNTLTFGFDYKQYGGKIEKGAFVKKGTFDVTEYAPYIHMQQLFFKRFIASGGVRWESHEIYGNQLLPKVGLVSHLNEKISLRASTAKGFRSPSIRELYLFPPSNPNLIPEKMWNYETGLTWSLYHNIKMDVALFMLKGTDMIRMQGRWPNARFANSADFTHTGYELSLDWIPINNLKLVLGWAKVDVGDETRNIPGKKLSFLFSFWLGNIEISPNLLYIQDLYGADFRREPMDDYILANLSGKIDIFKGLGIRGSIENLLNVDYQTMFGYPMPKRSLNVELMYDF
jgi:outer membrane cobalamin receptor